MDCFDDSNFDEFTCLPKDNWETYKKWCVWCLEKSRIYGMDYVLCMYGRAGYMAVKTLLFVQ